MDSSAFRDRLRGMGWFVAACQVISQIVSLAVLALLYRSLGPEPFGLLAMALPAMHLGRLLAGFGISAAGVARESLDEESQAALFWCGTGWSLVVACGVSLSGLFFAWFFDRPILAQVLPVLAITLVLASLGLLHQIRLERAMRLSAVAGARVVALTLGGVAALVAASYGGGVWALVVQQLAEWGALMIGFWIAAPWMPRFVRPTAATWQTFRQGGTFTASSLAFWVGQNVDTLVVGRWGSAFQLGLYSQAYNLVMKPVLLVTTPLTAVMLPTLSRFQGESNEYRRLISGFFRMVGILLFPCGLGLLVFPVNVMQLLGGKDWSAGEAILRVLAPLILMQGFLNVCGSVFASLGRFDRLLKGSLVYAAMILIATLAAVGWNAAGLSPHLLLADKVAIGVTAVTGLFMLGYLPYCLRTVPVSVRVFIHAIWLSAAAAVGMAIGVLLVSSLSHYAYEMRLHPYLAAITAIVSGVAFYAVFAVTELRWLVRSNRSAI